MNITDLVERIAAEHDLPKRNIRAVLDAAFTIIGATVANGEEVSLPGFGKFKTSDRPAREGRNPATGTAIQIQASRKATFSPAKQLKGQVNTKA